MDLAKFMNASLAPREAEVPVPELADFFGKDEQPIWKVRGLTAAEVARSREASDRSEKIKSLVEAMAGDGDKAAAIRENLGLSGDEVPEDVSRRIEMLCCGSISPALDDEHRDVAVQLAAAFPIKFYEITNAIQELTGQGAELGKRKPSGGKKTSASR